MQPTLSTERLTLRPATDADLPALHACWREPQVRKFLFDDREVTSAIAADVLAGCLAFAAQGMGLWTVWHADTIVGNAGIYPVSTAGEYEPRIAGLVEPLVALHAAHQHRGYAGEALGALLSHGFTALGRTVIAAVSDEPNIASQRMLLRAGFEPLSVVAGPANPLCTYVQSAGRWHGRQQSRPR